ncbi:MAG: phage portal protein [Methylobacter sp.]|uniref:phage portal protein n=1 Tax=Methylobacter sp. TaxID=2051955 RepID=UPI0025FF22BA|nr:phage portal protein [Methylobacter sp.]MCK9622233.1 phage portal protein [Methylobacter sp.]
MANLLDNAIAAVAPGWAFRRAQSRRALAAYEAASPRRNGGKMRPDNSSADLLTLRASGNMRGYARVLEQNHDLASGILDTLVNNVVGANGISVEPMPRRKNGELHTEFSKQLLKLWTDFKKRPDVTWEHQWPQVERLMCRAWMRDGEAFMQYLEGFIIGLDHGTKVPLSVELIEADYLPHWYRDDSAGIDQSIERNGWGRARNYWVLKDHPQGVSFQYGNSTDMRRVPADKMTHLKLVTRFRQSRGVSVFATIMIRLENIKDYEESEQIAARVAAAMCAAIVKGTPDTYVSPETETDREFKFSPGMVFDNLQEGERVETIQSNRPSGLLGDFRYMMLRAAAAGSKVNFHSISKDFNGTYVGLRLAMVDADSNYKSLTNEFIGSVTQPTYERFARLAVLSGAARITADLDMDTLTDAEYFGPRMASADPLKEGRANIEAVQAGHKSSPQVIRENGANPDAVMEQSAQWQKNALDKDLNFTTFNIAPAQEGQFMDNATTSG